MKMRAWITPASLLAVSFIPLALTASRLVWVAGGEKSAQSTPELAHMIALPWPIVTHIVLGSVFCIIASFQFAPELRAKFPSWHRAAGRVAAVSGIISALTGMLMTIIYPLGELSTVPMAVIRFAFGAFMTTSIVLAVFYAMKKSFANHRAWMIRAFAIGVAGATQGILLGAWLGITGALTKEVVTVMIAVGFAINWAFAEWRIRKRPASQLQIKGSAL